MTFQNQYTSLRINGILFEKKDLLNKTWQEQIDTYKVEPDWLLALQSFLEAWLNEDNFVMVNTSGSTGKPKKIKLLKQQMVNSARMTGQYFQFSSSNNALLCLPCNYIAGKMMVLRAMVWKMNLIVVPPIGNPMKKIAKVIHFAAMIPLQVSNILSQTPDKVQLIQRLLIGGGKVDGILNQKLQGLSTDCFASYAMTETITHVAIKKLNKTGADDYFQALPNVDFNIDDRGCLTISAPHLNDNILITNDLVALENQHSFEWLGRVDNVINTGGVKVYPEKIEAKLEKQITKRFFITALPDAKLENKVILIIEDEKWSSQKTNALMLEMKSILSKFELPKNIYFLNAFIETPTKKIQRKRTKNYLIKFKL